MQRFSIGKFKVSKVNLSSAIGFIGECVKNGRFGYICVSNARVAYQSNHNPDYCAIQNSSLLTVPDGKPLVWIAHNQGHKEVGQVAGNELFHGLLKESMAKGYSHYFYGSTPSTIETMTRKMASDYPDVELKGAVSPPFQPIEAYDIDALACEINKKAPTFLWVGLGAPKQERLMELLQPKLKSTICIGVGLVFEYYAGTVKRAPKWARRLGLEGVVRCLQQPKRLISPRMMKPVFWIVFEIFKSKRHAGTESQI